MKRRKSECEWHYDGDDLDFWQTDCGQEFVLTDGTPIENGMRFCCYCGKKLVEKIKGRRAQHASKKEEV